MKAFITGATGFVGREVLRSLHDAGYDIRILSRNPEANSVQEIAREFGAEIHRGDVVKGAALAEGLTGIDAIIHLVGIISEFGDQTFENVHTLGTKNIVAAARASGVKRFIQMSALGVRENAVSRYHRSKWAAEQIVRGSALDWTIFRPSIIYGAEDHFVNLFARIARFSPVMPVMGNGKNKMQPAPVGDVAKCFVGALSEKKSIGQTYDLCGPGALSFDEVLDTILEVTRRKRLKLHLPMGPARVQAALMEFIFPALLRRPSPLNRDQLLMLQEDNVGDPRPANGLFGLKPISFREGIAAYLKH